MAPWQRISGLAFHLKRAFLADVNNGQHVRAHVFYKEFTVVFTFKKRRKQNSSYLGFKMFEDVFRGLGSDICGETCVDKALRPWS